MVVVTFSVDQDLTVEERLRLKDRVADAYRNATSTIDPVGVDRVERRRDEVRWFNGGGGIMSTAKWEPATDA